MSGVIDEAFVEISPRFKDFSGPTRRESDKAAGAIRKSFGEAVTDVGNKVSQTGQNISRVGGTLTRNITLPILGAGAAAVKFGGEFETNMRKITALVGVPRKQVQAWESEVRSLGVEFGISGDKAAGALFFITSAGLRGDAAMDALEKSLKASAVGLGEVETIADLTTSAMNAYKDSGLTAANATDVLAAAVREGKLEADELSGAIGATLPVASSMGVRFDEVGAAFAAMSRTGTGASEAATQLRGILNTLLKPSKEAEDTLADMGLSAEGLRKQIREKGLLSTLETLTDSFGDNEEAQAKVFGNVRALSGVMDLMGGNVEDTRAIFEAMEDTTGTLDAAFDEMSQTTEFKVQQAIAQIKDLMLEVASTVLPMVAEAAERLTSVLGQMVEQWQGLSPQTQKFIVQGAAIAAAIGPALLVIGKLVTLIGTGIVIFGKIASAIALIANPITIAIAAIGLLVAGIVLLWQNSETFRNIVLTVWDAVKTAISTAIDVARAAIDGIVAVIQKVMQFIQPLIGFFIELGASVVSTFAGPVQQAGQSFMHILGAIGEAGKMVFEAVVGGVREIVSVFMEDLLPSILAFWDAVSPFFVWLADIIGTVITGAFQLWFNTVSPILQWIANTVAKVLAKAFEVFWGIAEPILMFLIDILVDTLVTAWNGLVNIVKGAFKIIGGLLDVFTGIFTGNWGKMWEGIKKIGTGIWNAIKGAFQLLISVGLLKPLKVGLGLIRSLWNTVWGGIKRVVTTIWNGIKSVVGGAVNAVRTRISTVFNRAKATIKSVFTAVLTIIRNTWGRIREVIATRLQAIRDRIKGVVDWIRNFFSGAKDWLVNAGKNIINGLLDGLKKAFTGVVDWVKGAAGKIRDMWPFSPAKDGPLRSHPMDKAGFNIMRDLGRGIAAGQGLAVGEMEKAAGMIVDPAQAGIAMPSRSGSASSGFTHTGESLPAQWIDQLGRVMADAMPSTLKLQIGSEIVLARVVRKGDVQLDQIQPGWRHGA